MRTITTTLTWTRYDGTPETLPEDGIDVLLCADGEVRDTAYFFSEEENEWCIGPHSIELSVGDLWAYWPEAPEVLE